ncbi:MAG: hypothetical protein K2Y27_05610 [Xanthobacteraceae bacterium]|nr:hypothetical protein [Xanthobacteraceae bacterium]
MNTFVMKIRGLRSFLSAPICRRLAASLVVLLIAFAAIAATTAPSHTPADHGQSGGGNLMLLPGWIGLAPVLW